MRSKPVTIACRITKEKKEAFYEKVRQLGKKPQEVLYRVARKPIFGRANKLKTLILQPKVREHYNTSFFVNLKNGNSCNLFIQEKYLSNRSECGE